MSRNEQKTLSVFDYMLTDKDERNLKAFRRLLELDHIEVFSCDDFRRYQLDRFIGDKQHGIGGFFAKLKKNGLVVEVGYIRSQVASNHGRMIRCYRWVKEVPTQ